MTLTDNWSLVYGGLVIGEGTDWRMGAGITGLGVDYRNFDIERGMRNGDIGAIDVYSARTMTFPIFTTVGLTCEQLEEDDCASLAAITQEKLTTLKGAWRAAGADGALDLKIPGLPEDQVRLYGRPRGVDALYKAGSPTIGSLLTFKAMDPLMYGEAVTGAPSLGSFSVMNAGFEATERVTIEVTCNGGIPIIVNHSDGDGNINFAVAASGTRILDLKAKTCVDGSGNDRYDELAPGLTWFTLQPGVNNLSATGCTSVVVEHQPAWM